MIIKEGVSLAGIQPTIVLALLVTEQVFLNRGELLVVTSALDGVHMRGSLHYVGAAVDVGLPPSNVAPTVADIAIQLGDNYDVVLEAGHIHIEFQPKVGA